MNKVVLMGRLVRDPEVRYSSQGDGSGLAIGRYTLAVDRRTAKKEGQSSADFIRCVAFGRSAEFAEKYLKKGVRILIEGRIQTGSYQNPEGTTIYTTDVIVEQQEFADSKNGNSENEGSRSEGKGDRYVDEEGFMNIPDGMEDEGLPFN